MGGMTQHTHAIPLTIDYVEIPVTDMQASLGRVSGTAFGWSFTTYGDQYSGIRTAAESDSDGDEAGGLLLAESVTRGGPLVLIYSDNLESTLDAVTGAGGTVINGPYEFPGGRRFHFLDPSGNELGVWTAAPLPRPALGSGDERPAFGPGSTLAATAPGSRPGWTTTM